jgi:hypothetical protein
VIEVTELVLTTATGVVGWAALRLVRRVDDLGGKLDLIKDLFAIHDKALAGVVIKLENGLSTEIAELKRDIREHMDGEEMRIITMMKALSGNKHQ